MADLNKLLFGLLMVLVVCASIALSPSANAQQKYRVVKYSNGTGFFVSQHGHLVTNAHVVDKCKSVQISGDGMIARARVLAKDKDNDMALLQSSMTPPATASFRPANYMLEEGEKVVVIGHPLGKSLTTRSSKLVDNRGPMGEEKWLQFSNSVFQGNSGGPLLDSSGQVIGMITAKSTLYRYNPQLAKREVVGNNDIAIRTHMLEAFLEKYQVPMRYNHVKTNLSPHRIKDLG